MLLWSLRWSCLLLVPRLPVLKKNKKRRNPKKYKYTTTYYTTITSPYLPEGGNLSCNIVTKMISNLIDSKQHDVNKMVWFYLHILLVLVISLLLLFLIYGFIIIIIFCLVATVIFDSILLIVFFFVLFAHLTRNSIRFSCWFVIFIEQFFSMSLKTSF